MMNQNKKISIISGYSRRSRLFANKMERCLKDENFEIVSLAKKTRPDLIVVFGGDGTMIYAVRTFHKLNAPFLGINRGHLGFLMNDTEKQKKSDNQIIKEVIEKIKNKNFKTKTYPLISCKTEKKQAYVFGDLTLLNSLRREESFQTIKLDIELDNNKLFRYSGDGLIISSSIGSTAYNLSAKGPAVHRDIDCLVVTPNNPHPSVQFRSLFFPLVLPRKTLINISVVDSKKRPAQLVTDGENLGPVDKATITTSNKSVRLLYLKENYIENLAKKMINPSS
ncbi:MAG: NAD(+)/NADH kinase [Patescibacteria group bacterium]|nr:NAD(+)/NADH kinase [Patescibacteria group bacterium]